MRGVEDHSTLASRNSLAYADERADRTTEALSLLEKNRTDCELFLGAEDPLTSATSSRLESLSRRAERRAERQPSAKKAPRRR
ncbi:hypothetical protein [Nocardia iowensis]|uniref:Uncharacterized protein n=1 Tax=Nocardia iowensis TaxID=204891 RepID=A0ABX8RXZ8_NOCIO|nr:hypothetical protein [Nocardia iowensis]QXN94423.1 hypothetical protein KV110_15995 [Nocardia iowensis]